MPGSRIPIVAEERLRADRPDDVVHPAVEPARRGDGAARLRARLGRSVRHRRARAEVRAVKVAVTGASGFVGRHVVAALERAGVEPTLWVRPSRRCRRRRGIASRGSTSPIRRRMPSQALGRPDVLIHLAWGGLPNYQSLHHFERELPAHYRAAEATGRRRPLDPGRRRHLLRIRHAVGAARRDAGRRAGQPVRARQGRARRQLQELQRERPFALTWARLFYLYGEGQARDRALVAAASRGRVGRGDVRDVGRRAAARLPAGRAGRRSSRRAGDCDVASTASSTSARGSRSRCDRWSRAGSRRTPGRSASTSAAIRILPTSRWPSGATPPS